MQGLWMLKRILIKKSKGNFCALKSEKPASLLKMELSLKIPVCIKQNIQAIIFSKTFTHNLAEQIKKGVICVQILLKIHQT